MIRPGAGPESERSFHDDLHAGLDDAFMRKPIFLEARKRLVERFVRAADLDHESEVLSIGCGIGLPEQLLAPNVKHVVGIDFSVNAIEKARMEFACPSNLSFEVLDVTTEGYKLPEGRFDAVFLLGFLHHVPETQLPSVLNVVFRTLKPGGLVYSIDPSRRRLIRLFRRLVERTYERFHSPEERELDTCQIQDWYVKSGFRILRVSWVDFFFIPFAYVFPNTPRWLIRPLSVLNHIISTLPVLRDFSSSFAVLARACK